MPQCPLIYNSDPKERCRNYQEGEFQCVNARYEESACGCACVCWNFAPWPRGAAKATAITAGPEGQERPEGVGWVAGRS